MNWRPPLLAACAVAAAAVAWWVAPMLLDPVGLGEFVFVGRFCSVILVLSAAEPGLARLASWPGRAAPGDRPHGS